MNNHISNLGKYTIKYFSCVANNNDNANITTCTTNVAKGLYIISAWTNEYNVESDWGNIDINYINNGSINATLSLGRGRYQASKYHIIIGTVNSTSNSVRIHCWKSTSATLTITLSFVLLKSI